MKTKLLYIGIAYLLISLYPMGSAFIVFMYLDPKPTNLDDVILVFIEFGYWGVWVVVNSVLGLLISTFLMLLFKISKLDYILIMAALLFLFNFASTLIYPDILLLIRNGRIEPYITLFHGILLYLLYSYKNKAS